MKKKNMLILGIGAALATAATVFFMRKKKSSQVEKPSKKAPQIPLGNPGDQSEFTTSATESELG